MTDEPTPAQSDSTSAASSDEYGPVATQWLVVSDIGLTTMSGSDGSLTGYFTKFIAQGILNTSGNTGLLDYGVRSIQLTG